MPQLTKGARDLLDQIHDLLGAIRHYAGECDLADIKMFPNVVEHVLLDIDRTAAALQEKVAAELEPMLQRQASNSVAAGLAERLAAVEQQLADLQRERRVVPFRRKRS